MVHGWLLIALCQMCPVTYFSVTICIYNYTTIRAYACICTRMHVSRFINFKETVQMVKLRAGIMMTCICPLWQWCPNSTDFEPQNILPSYNNCSMLLAILKKSIFSPLRKWKWKSLSHVWLFATPWSTQSMEFSRILEWVAFPFARGWIFPTQASNPGLPHCRPDSLPAEPQGKPFIPYSSETVIFKISKLTCTSILYGIFPSLPTVPNYAKNRRKQEETIHVIHVGWEISWESKNCMMED